MTTAVDLRGKTAAVAIMTLSEPAPHAINVYDIERRAVIRVIPLNDPLISMFWLGKEDLLLTQTVDSKAKVQVLSGDDSYSCAHRHASQHTKTQIYTHLHDTHACFNITLPLTTH